jgi:hypothetical protein
MYLGFGLHLGPRRRVAAIPPQPSTQWRIINTNTVGYCAISEMEMRGEHLGADLCTGGAPSASSQFNGSYPPSYAFDDLIDVFLWHSANEGISWLQYTFAAPVLITEITIRARNDGSEGGTTPRNFSMQYHNGTSWVTSWAATTGPWSPNEVRTFTRP